MLISLVAVGIHAWPLLSPPFPKRRNAKAVPPTDVALRKNFSTFSSKVVSGQQVLSKVEKLARRDSILVSSSSSRYHRSTDSACSYCPATGPPLSLYLLHLTSLHFLQGSRFLRGFVRFNRFCYISIR
jgi:hypothetical protein